MYNMQYRILYLNRGKLAVNHRNANSIAKVLEACSTFHDDDSSYYYAACDLLLAAYCDCLVKRYKQRTKRNRRIATDEAFARRVRINHALKASRANDRARRNAIKTSPACAWANRQSIARIYEIRDELTALTGVEHHVDHIVPLVGKNLAGEHIVCGLHNEHNLRVTTKHENLSKGCYFNADEL
jgi:hypothetical protein